MIVIATPGIPKNLKYEIEPGGIIPLSPGGLIFGNTKQDYVEQITKRLRDAGFDLATCFSKELKDQLTKRGFQSREALAEHEATMGYPGKLSRSRRPVVSDSEILLDTVVQEYGFIVKKTERVRITMAVAAWLDHGNQNWRLPILTVNPTQIFRLMRGTKGIEIPGLMTWKDRMEIEMNVEDVASGFTFACREFARNLIDEIPK